MENIDNVKKLTRASMLLVFAFIVIFIGSRLGGVLFNQFVVGPLVNAVIISAVLITDIKFGVLVAVLTPILAAVTGQLAAAFIPFVPFIMAGNAVLAVTLGLVDKYIKKYGMYMGVVLGAILKAVFLGLCAKYATVAFGLSIPQKMLPKLVAAMSYPQLYSAIGGGVVAIIFYSIYKKSYSRA